MVKSKKFVIYQSISNQYHRLHQKLLKNRKNVEVAKFGGVIVALLFFVGVYLYYVNASSTQGYFLREKMSLLDDRKFDHNIVSLDVLQAERQLWEDIQNATPITNTSPLTISLDQ